MYRKKKEEESGIGSAVAVGLSPSLAAANTHLLFPPTPRGKQNLLVSCIGQLLPIPSSVVNRNRLAINSATTGLTNKIDITTGTGSILRHQRRFRQVSNVIFFSWFGCHFLNQFHSIFYLENLPGRKGKEKKVDVVVVCAVQPIECTRAIFGHSLGLWLRVCHKQEPKRSALRDSAANIKEGEKRKWNPPSFFFSLQIITR